MSVKVEGFGFLYNRGQQHFLLYNTKKTKHDFIFKTIYETNTKAKMKTHFLI